MTRQEFLRTFLTCVVFRPSTDLRRSDEQAIEQVSVLQLIANSEKYDDKTVLVAGFLRLETEGDVLYLHEEDYKHHLFKNRVWFARNDLVIAKAAEINNHYVTLIGTFSSKYKGHRSITSGGLRDITYARLTG